MMQNDQILIQLKTMLYDAIKEKVMLCNSVWHRDVPKSEYHIRKGNLCTTEPQC